MVSLPFQKPTFLLGSEAVVSSRMVTEPPLRSHPDLFDIISCTKITLDIEGSPLGFLQPWLLICEAINLIIKLLREDPVCCWSLAPGEQ